MSYVRIDKMKLIIFFTITVFLGALFLYLYNLEEPSPAASNPKDPLLSAFEETGGQFKELTAQSWGCVATGDKTIDDLKGLYEKIAAALGEEAKLEITDTTEKNYIGVVAEGKTSQGYQITITLQTIKDGYEDDETYLIVDLQESLDPAEAANIRATADSCFAALGATGETSLLIAGTFEDILTTDAKDELSQAIFTAIGGEVVEAVDSGSYISQSGYCPGLPGSITSRGKEINLQVALYDNEVENQTGILLGTPLIFSEY